GRGRGAAVRADRTRLALYVSGRELGDEYRYVLERRGAKRFPGLLVDRPSLLLNPWSRRTTTTDVATARAGGAFQKMASPMMAGRVSGAARPRPEPIATAATASYDFVPDAPIVVANLTPVGGAVTLPA